MTEKTALTGSNYHWSADFGVFQNISDDSYRRGFAEGEKTGYSAGEKAGYDAGHTAGRQAEYDRFWDVYQENGKRTEYRSAFCGKGWNNDTFYPKYDISGSAGIQTFYYLNDGNRDALDLTQRLAQCGVKYDSSQSTYLSSTFFSAYLSRIPEVSAVSADDLDHVFAYGWNLETIDKLILKDDGSNRFTNTFIQCPKLKNIVIAGVIGKNLSFSYSSLLSDESVQSILDHLQDLTGQAQQALTFHADVGARLTDAQKATVTAKNWTLVY